MVYAVLEFREENQIFTKVDGGNVDFSLQIMTGCDTKVAHQCLLLHSWPPKKKLEASAAYRRPNLAHFRHQGHLALLFLDPKLVQLIILYWDTHPRCKIPSHLPISLVPL